MSVLINKNRMFWLALGKNTMCSFTWDDKNKFCIWSSHGRKLHFISILDSSREWSVLFTPKTRGVVASPYKAIDTHFPYMGIVQPLLSDVTKILTVQKIPNNLRNKKYKNTKFRLDDSPVP
jgi:hypothetical protein